MKQNSTGTKRCHTHSGSIQKRILSITISCLLGMCVIISSVSYYIFQNYLQHSLIQSTETSLQLLSDTVNNSMNDIYQMVRFCQTSSHVADYIANNPNPGSVLSVSTYDRINEEYTNNPSSSSMPRLAVITNQYFLQIVNTTYSSTADLAAGVPELSFFEELLNDQDYNFSTGFMDDPFNPKRKQILPVIRPITYKFNSVQGGFLFLEISSDLFTDAFKRYALAEDSALYLTLGEHHYRYEEGLLTEVTADYSLHKDMSEGALIQGIRISNIKNGEGSSRIMVTAPLDMPDCYISQSISHSELQDQRRLLWGILFGTLISIIAIGILLMLMLNRMINIPVSRIRAKMLRIAEGDFSRDPSIEWDHELGDIGRGINDLSQDVYLLMNKRLEDEKQKKDLEYKMLQSQINPHFIYNTLNSIKWMATIQGAEGISEMTTSLAKLLKSISKGTSLLVTVREEFSLLQDYFTIQSYRYGGTITMEISVDDETIYDCHIIKFTLQPLVENAIFHGIEPKGTGHITIHAFYTTGEDNSSDIRIDVRDNGVGMSEEKAKQILNTNDERSTDFFREIGVSNVHKRLLYEFGTQYGITIESVENEYTVMSIRIPGKS
ncbi:MAG: sensor histidine kinase [Lachnospiraceae bacterium]|nr:sensor histidine kinase [Lachnospiraceae bacterium]